MFQANMRRFMLITGMVMGLFIPVFPLHTALALGAEDLDAAALKNSVDRIKLEPRGPFRRIRWFCHDGSVLPPHEYACRGHGGGNQHGQWSAQILHLRKQGYLLANVLAAVDAADFIGSEPRLDELKQILLERYLISVDDGWVFRQARFYRGALQIEDEQAAARKMVLAMLGDPDWLRPARFLLLREAVRLLPVSHDSALVAGVRQIATEMAKKDPGFQALRVKIHSLPNAGDAALVRAYAQHAGLPGLAQDYESLAAQLDTLYAPKTFLHQLQLLERESTSRAFRHEISDVVQQMAAATGPAAAIAVAAAKAQSWRRLLQGNNRYTVYNRLRLLRASLLLEQQTYVLGNQLLVAMPSASRRVRLGWLVSLGRALNAAALIPDALWHPAEEKLNDLRHTDTVSAARYESTLAYLTRVSQWAQRAMAFQFSATIKQWQRLTPLAINFVPDQLRNSPLLAFTRVLDSLTRDVQQQTGLTHHVFGQNVGSGLRALNPGISRGILLEQPDDPGRMRADGIYILQSTMHALPPVAGIITRGEGSSLSHVQLLARNMGIPNLVASDDALMQIRRHIGERVEMAVSQRGVISIASSPEQIDRDNVSAQQGSDMLIDADLSKLQLHDATLRSLRQIRASDSGRTVGPKAANLAELMHFYPTMVNPGVVIPFAVFRRHLNQPLYAGGPAVFDWMTDQYRRLRSIKDPAERNKQAHVFLSRLRDWIVHSRLDAAFLKQLRVMLDRTLGKDGSYGVFVRSDTNVEDLPGFSGAGLNLTVANVVGFDAIVSAVLRVWASPFTYRAYAWRQSHMQRPEHVYPAVLLMKSFASEVSGVMVTRDVDTGNADWLSIAVNEGVSGAVAGQAAEELRVRRSNGQTRLLAVATAPLRAALSATGGMLHLPASGRGQLLSRDEIRKLVVLAADVDKRFPLPRQPDGRPVAADIEFGFAHGQLALFQIRPFVESKRARESQTLLAMDRQLPDISGMRIDLRQAPAP